MPLGGGEAHAIDVTFSPWTYSHLVAFARRFLTCSGEMPARSAHHARLGGAIRARRNQLGISQEALAEEIGIDRTYLSGVERGERNPSYTNLLRISTALRIPLSELQAAAEARGGKSV